MGLRPSLELTGTGRLTVNGLVLIIAGFDLILSEKGGKPRRVRTGCVVQHSLRSWACSIDRRERRRWRREQAGLHSLRQHRASAVASLRDDSSLAVSAIRPAVVSSTRQRRANRNLGSALPMRRSPLRKAPGHEVGPSRLALCPVLSSYGASAKRPGDRSVQIDGIGRPQGAFALGEGPDLRPRDVLGLEGKHES